MEKTGTEDEAVGAPGVRALGGAEREQCGMYKCVVPQREAAPQDSDDSWKQDILGIVGSALVEG